MKAQFYAFDANGGQQSPSTSEITVSENGIPRTVTSVTCPPSAPLQALSSVLVMDVSGSMASGASGTPNIDIAKAAATLWINTVGLGRSECALTSFDDNNYFNQDFTTNKTKLQNAIGNLTPQNGTNYDAGLLQAPSGGLEVTKLAKHARVIIFLTDGMPNFQPQTAAIIAEAKRQNCLIYSVTVGLPCPQCLQDISTQTGAAWYENITTQADIEDVYKKILHQAQNAAPPCEITWQSNSQCTAAATSVVITWQGQTAMLNYFPPASSLAKLTISPSILLFKGKKVNVQFDTVITITATNAPFVVSGITRSNPVFDINPKSFSLQKGETKSLTVSYTPKDSTYQWTQFNFSDDHCPVSCFAAGSYPGFKAAPPVLRIVAPNGGEQYLAGIDTFITWTGIPLTEAVSLAYSIDAGANWIPITASATGGSYPWHVPNTPSNKCLVKADLAGTGGGGGAGFAVSAGGKDQDDAGSIVVDAYGNYYVTGFFIGTARFGSTTFTATSYGTNNYNDAFLAKYHPDGSLEWVKQIGSIYGDAGLTVAIDSSGDIVSDGFFGNTVDFGGISLTAKGSSDLYLAKYHPDGTPVWVQQFWGTNPACGSIAIDASGNIFTAGSFQGTIHIGFYTFTSGSGTDGFFAKILPDGSVSWAKQIAGGPNVYSGTMTLDQQGDLLMTGFFDGTLNLSTGPLTASGNQDIFLAKYHSTDGSLQWAKRMGGSGYNNAYGIGCDAIGNTYLTGGFSGTGNFDAFTLTSAGSYDIYIAKYRPDGTCEWAKRAGGTGSDGAYGLHTLPTGLTYITGAFNDVADFDGNTVTSAGFADLFIAAYNPDGSLSWVKSAGGTGNEIGFGITSDPNGNIAVCGTYGNTVDFDGTNLTEKGSDDIFIWKLGSGNPVVADTSDALFSIVAPVPLSTDIDMGKVFVASSKDSVVQGFIRNGGTFPIQVDSLAITGANASVFGLVSGIPPYTIPPGGSQRVEFHFAPMAVGIRSATIEIFTRSAKLTQNIQGEGIQQTIAVLGNIIDFGQVNIGSQKDTTISIAIKNNGSTSVIFTASPQLGPDKTQFSLQSGSAPFTLAPGASQSVSLRFRPKYIGRTSGRIGFDYGSGSPATLSLFGQGIGGIVAIKDDSGYAGDHKNIPMLLEKVPVTSVQSAATNFSARVAYDKTILYSPSANIQHGKRYDTLSITSSLGSTDTLALIPFTVMLGESKTSPMNIVDFAWLDGTGQPADYDAETESGTFYLLGICPEGGARLINPDGQVSMAHINPNPASGVIHIEINTTEIGTTRLELMNLLGQRVTIISDSELKPGDHSFDLNSHDLPSGSYYLVLQTPTMRRLQRIDIQK